VIALVQLQAHRDARVTTLSGGQRRRLDLAVALVGDPDIVFLDEPTTGFDPAARRQAWAVVKDLAHRGRTIFLTTHSMEEAEYLADRVAIMVGGEIVAAGSPTTLIRAHAGESTVTFRLPGVACGLPAGLPGHLHTQPDGAWTLTTSEPTVALHVLTGWALSHRIPIEALCVSQRSLEDIYLALTAKIGAVEERP
jgi:ABC-2 type transport system ATP-binding protein